MADLQSTWYGINTTASLMEDYNGKVKFEVKSAIALYVPLLTACLTGNILVCVTVMGNRDKRSKRWYYFLMNLAIADMALALLSPLHAMQVSLTNLGKCADRGFNGHINVHVFFTSILLTPKKRIFNIRHTIRLICDCYLVALNCIITSIFSIVFRYSWLQNKRPFNENCHDCIHFHSRIHQHRSIYKYLLSKCADFQSNKPLVYHSFIVDGFYDSCDTLLDILQRE